MKRLWLIATVYFGLGAALGLADEAGGCNEIGRLDLSGYTQRTFPEQFDKSTVDLLDSGDQGFAWYLRQFFGHKSSSREGIMLSPDGSVTLEGAAILSAAPANSPQKWVGTAFGGGGYFEAELKFDPTNLRSQDAWPSFWSMSIEHFANTGADTWLGQLPGYTHFAEADVFEYDLAPAKDAVRYGATVHDWYGIYDKTCPGKVFCDANTTSNGGSMYTKSVVEASKGVNFNDYHKYGLLWMPATKSNRGYIRFYFDGCPVLSPISWSAYNGEAPPPGKNDWTFGIIDAQHLVLVLQTGDETPMTVRSITVMQISPKTNLTH